MADEATAVFKEAVKEFVEIHNQLAEAAKSLKEVRQKKNELAEVILDYMQKNNYEVCSSGNTKLIKKDSKRQAGLKTEYILSAVKEMFGNNIDHEKFIDSINSKREVSFKPMLSCKVLKN